MPAKGNCKQKTLIRFTLEITLYRIFKLTESDLFEILDNGMRDMSTNSLYLIHKSHDKNWKELIERRKIYKI